MYTINNMNEYLKNCSLPEVHKLRIHFFNNPNEVHTLTGEQLVDLLVDTEKKAIDIYKTLKGE